MTGKSHAFIGGAAGYLATGGNPVGAVIGAAAALLVDIDEPGSTISRVITPPGTHSKMGRFLLVIILYLLALQFGKTQLFYLSLIMLALTIIPHRGPLHSPFPFAVICLIVYFYYGLNIYSIAFLAGYGSHLFLTDFFTDRGLSLWPLNGRIGIGLVTTGGMGEYILVTAIMGGVIIYFI